MESFRKNILRFYKLILRAMGIVEGVNRSVTRIFISLMIVGALTITLVTALIVAIISLL